MIGLDQIKNAIVKRLSTAYPDIHVVSEDVSQIETLEESAFPLLHVQLNLQGCEIAMGADTRDMTLFVDITYMESTKTTNAKLYEMQIGLILALGCGFQVGDRFLKIQSINGTNADDLLHVTFQLEYNDAIPESEEYELFTELDLNIGG